MMSVGSLVVAVGGVLLVGGNPAEAAAAPCAEVGCVAVVEVDGWLDPVLADFVSSSIEAAEATDGQVAVVIRLESPGSVLSPGQLERLVRTVVTSSVPVSVWVGPSGAAVGGGATELLAAVEDKWGSSGVAPGAEIEVPASRDLRGTGLDVMPATASPGVVYDAKEAVKASLVSRVSPTVGDHIVGLDGVSTDRITRKSHGRDQVRLVPTSVVTFSKLPMGAQLLHTAASPSVAYLALIIGLGLLVFEFFTAGVGVAGVIGALAVVMGGYGLGVLPHRTWALAAILCAMVAFAIDAQTGIPRFWTGVGIVLFSAGSLFLFGRVGRPWLALVVGLVGMITAMVSGMPSMIRSRFGTPTVGRESMLGAEGVAVDGVDPEGTVRVAGAVWLARTNRATPIRAGEPVLVSAIDGLVLEVEPPEGAAKDYREARRKREGDGVSG